MAGKKAVWRVEVGGEGPHFGLPATGEPAPVLEPAADDQHAYREPRPAAPVEDLEEEEEERKYEVVRRGERRVVSRVISKAGTGHGYTYEALSFRKRNKKMEPFLLTVSERAGEETLYNHEGEEFLLILKGKAEVILEDERLLLEAGDAVYFDAALKHRLLSYDGQEVKVLAVVTR